MDILNNEMNTLSQVAICPEFCYQAVKHNHMLKLQSRAVPYRRHQVVAEDLLESTKLTRLTQR